MNKFDIVIIGGGVVGCSIARELSKRKLKIAVLEKMSDIGEGASKANSGIVHAGFDTVPGTLKARLNRRGSQLMPLLADELDFPYENNGSLVLAFSDDDLPALEELLEKGRVNGVTGLAIIDGEAARELEPRLSESVRHALHAPTGAIVCPFGLTVAMAENAALNGVEFFRNCEVVGINRVDTHDGLFRIVTTHTTHFYTSVIINAAGLFSDEIHALVSQTPLSITPRRGEYLLFDKVAAEFTTHTLFQVPTIYGKGVLITPTTHGNLMIGPNAFDIEEKAGVNTTADGLLTVATKAARSIEELPMKELISSFAGLRSFSNRTYNELGDFIIGEVEDAKGFIDVAGIDSPGLSSAPAIAEYVGVLVDEMLYAPLRNDFVKKRKAITDDTSASGGEVICRCEMITRRDIVEAIRRTDSLFANPGIVSLDSIKRRVRAGSGRCQGGFCSPRIVELIATKLGIDKTAVPKNEPGSEILLEKI